MVIAIDQTKFAQIDNGIFHEKYKSKICEKIKKVLNCIQNFKMIKEKLECFLDIISYPQTLRFALLFFVINNYSSLFDLEINSFYFWICYDTYAGNVLLSTYNINMI